MASYTTRVVLFDATAQDYDTLHEAMKSAGFSRFIKSDTGKWYHLPEAEYDCTSFAGIEAVRSAASAAASRTYRHHSVFVTEAGARTWIGLTPASTFAVATM